MQAPEARLCRIEWNTLSPAQWEERFARIRRSNLLQSYDYARAVCGLQGLRGRWGVIFLNGQEAGLVQILEAAFLRRLIHAVIIDRGPLWYDGFGTSGDIQAFVQCLRGEFPRRLGRRMRIIPEIEAIAASRIMQECGFRAQNLPPYQTIWLDLRHSAAELRAGLKKNWRNMLTRAERSDITVEWSADLQALKPLLQYYAQDKAVKSYKGASIKTIMALAKTHAPAKKMMVGHALKDGKAVASILIFLHGTGATYQIGWTSQTGRAIGAQNYLLWNALDELQRRGILDFDLGGTNDDGAKTVKNFKAGMGGRCVTMAGLYV